jgi:hypothetical protein
VPVFGPVKYVTWLFLHTATSSTIGGMKLIGVHPCPGQQTLRLVAVKLTVSVGQLHFESALIFVSARQEMSPSTTWHFPPSELVIAVMVRSNGATQVKALAEPRWFTSISYRPRGMSRDRMIVTGPVTVWWSPGSMAIGSIGRTALVHGRAVVLVCPALQAADASVGAEWAEAAPQSASIEPSRSACRVLTRLG